MAHQYRKMTSEKKSNQWKECRLLEQTLTVEIIKSHDVFGINMVTNFLNVIYEYDSWEINHLLTKTYQFVLPCQKDRCNGMWITWNKIISQVTLPNAIYMYWTLTEKSHWNREICVSTFIHPQSYNDASPRRHARRKEHICFIFVKR